MTPRFDGVCLDVGGVFLLPPPEAAWAVRGGEGPMDLERHRSAHYAGMVSYDAAGGAWGSYLPGFCRGYGVNGVRLAAAVVALGAAFVAHPWTVRIEDSVAALRDVAATGARIAIVSNSDGTVTGQLRELGICQVGEGAGVPVDIVVDSHLAGVAKPDPRIFEPALAATGTAPARTLHVGDSVRADVGGARAAGLHPVHFDPLGTCAARDHDHVARLGELVALLS